MPDKATPQRLRLVGEDLGAATVEADGSWKSIGSTGELRQDTSLALRREKRTQRPRRSAVGIACFPVCSRGFAAGLPRSTTLGASSSSQAAPPRPRWAHSGDMIQIYECVCASAHVLSIVARASSSHVLCDSLVTQSQQGSCPPHCLCKPAGRWCRRTSCSSTPPVRVASSC